MKMAMVSIKKVMLFAQPEYSVSCVFRLNNMRRYPVIEIVFILDANCFQPRQLEVYRGGLCPPADVLLLYNIR